MSIRIDGSFGEGGGQILRTSLSLSLVTGQPFRIDNIRAGRAKPGLLRQHLTAVLAAAEVGNAKVDGAVLGSASVQFTPGLVRPGEYSFAVGTAGSATLVFQTVLPALMLASGPSKITLEGGTHNHAAPPYHFLAQTFLPLVERMGPKVALQFERYGFYPAGGGRFRAEVQPVTSTALQPIHIGARGEITSRRLIAVVSSLPYHIAQRELETAADLLNWDATVPRIADTNRSSPGPGNVVMIEIGSASGVKEIFTAFGKQGVTAERVAEEAVHEVREYLVSAAAAAEHLADQLLLPMALAGGGSFTATKLNMHARTNMDVISRFLPVSFETVEHENMTSVTITKRY
jgi:RNA 3'-terminal phosphate cyclase (ATP)